MAANALLCLGLGIPLVRLGRPRGFPWFLGRLLATSFAEGRRWPTVARAAMFWAWPLQTASAAGSRACLTPISLWSTSMTTW